MAERKIKMNEEKKKLGLLKVPDTSSNGIIKIIFDINYSLEVNSDENNTINQSRQSRFSRNDIRTTRGNDFPSNWYINLVTEIKYDNKRSNDSDSEIENGTNHLHSRCQTDPNRNSSNEKLSCETRSHNFEEKLQRVKNNTKESREFQNQTNIKMNMDIISKKAEIKVKLVNEE